MVKVVIKKKAKNIAAFFLFIIISFQIFLLQVPIFFHAAKDELCNRFIMKGKRKFNNSLGERLSIVSIQLSGDIENRIMRY